MPIGRLRIRQPGNVGQHQYQRVDQVTVLAQGVGHETVVGRVLRGGEQRPVQADQAAVVVDLVLVPAAARDLDQDVELHGSVVLGRGSAEQQRVGPAVQPAGQVEVHELLLGVLIEGVRPEFAAESALLVAAERVGGVDQVPVVDPDRAGLELAGTSRARWLSVLQTPADSPYSVSLAIRIAWSVLSARITARTGPQISSRAMVMSLATSSSVAGLRISNRSSASTQSPPMNIE
jgi:hypothetical protein